MLKLNLKIKIPRKLRAMDDKALQKVSQGAAGRLRLLLIEHFKSLGGRQFWSAAADKTQVMQSGSTSVQVLITQKGVSLQLHGGTVKPSGRVSEVTGKPIKRLLVPVSDSPLIQEKRRPLAEMGYAPEEIKVIPSKNGGPPRLAWQPKRKKKGQANADVTLGVLLPSVTITPHPNVLPTKAKRKMELEAGARDAIKELKH